VANPYSKSECRKILRIHRHIIYGRRSAISKPWDHFSSAKALTGRMAPVVNLYNCISAKKSVFIYNS